MLSVLQDKLDNKIAANEANVALNFGRFSNATSDLNDEILNLKTNKPKILTKEFGENNEKLIMRYDENLDNGFVGDKTIHPHAISQIAGRMKIPTAYLRELATGDSWQKKLAATMLNEYFANIGRERVLLRNVGNEIRGFLSNSYKRINSVDILKNYMGAVNANQLKVYDFHYGDTKFFIETVDRNIVTVDTPNNGLVSLAFGMRLANSDFGDGALQLSAFLMQVVCLNGMTRQHVLRNIHLGAKLNDNIEYSDATYRLNTQASVSALNDVVRHVLNPDYREKTIQSIANASSQIVEPEKEIKKLTQMGVTKGEIEELENLFMANKVEDGVQGEMSLFKLSQGVGAIGREKEPERKRFLDDVSGKILEPIWIN